MFDDVVQVESPSYGEMVDQMRRQIQDVDRCLKSRFPHVSISSRQSTPRGPNSYQTHHHPSDDSSSSPGSDFPQHLYEFGVHGFVGDGVFDCSEDSEDDMLMHDVR